MGDLQRKTDPALRVVRAIARLICAVIYLRPTKCQSLSVTVSQPQFAALLSAKRDVLPGAHSGAFKAPFMSLPLRFQPSTIGRSKSQSKTFEADVRQSMDLPVAYRR